MEWVIELSADFIFVCRNLYNWLITPIEFLGNVSPIYLLTGGLVGFLLLCLSLRIVRG